MFSDQQGVSCSDQLVDELLSPVEKKAIIVLHFSQFMVNDT